MALRRKKSQPVDRVVQDLDRQIADLERQLREAREQEIARATPATGASPGGSMTGFMKQMLAPSRAKGAAVTRARTDLFDLGDETLKQIDVDGGTTVAGAAAAAAHHQYGAPMPIEGEPAAVVAESPAEHDSRLARYLSAGTFRGQRPIKRAQRQHRNRFFMWVGLGCVTAWVLYVVIR